MNWKEHPIVIVSVTSAATIGFMLTIFFTLVIPTWTKGNENHILLLQNEKELLTNKIEESSIVISSLNSEISKQNITIGEKNKEIESLDFQIRLFKQENIFLDNDEYPLGFRDVQIGDPISKVEQIFTKNKIEKNRRWYSVEINNNIFTAVTYYYSESKSEKDKVVSKILFHIKSSEKIIQKLILQKFIDNFGQETISFHDVNGLEHQWVDVNGSVISIDDSTYLIQSLKYKSQSTVRDIR